MNNLMCIIPAGYAPSGDKTLCGRARGKEAGANALYSSNVPMVKSAISAGGCCEACASEWQKER